MAERALHLDDGTKLYVQKYEMTVAEWNRCFHAGACEKEAKPRPGWDAETTPATEISFEDAQQYVTWLTGAASHPFRLPSLEEWETMAREVLPEKPDPIFSDPSLTWASAYLVENLPARALEPTGSFPETSAGIADLSGSVWEWTQDCYEARAADKCSAYHVGGEHVAVISVFVRDPARGGCAVGAPPAHLGLRLVTERALL
ncbi:MAG: SUMF1/EgtB/PvdO family nonheme iron enzyme [Pseudomonadota bacterium]